MAGRVFETVEDTIEGMDRKLLEKRADEITVGLKDEYSLLGWSIGDEVKPQFLKKYLVSKQILESRDRSRTAVVLVNGMNSVEAFCAHHQVIVSDKYPARRWVPDGDDLWAVAWWMDEVRRASGDKPHWITLQAHRSDFSGDSATDAEVSMMSWLAIAGGADAVSYFTYSGNSWWYGPYIHNNWNQNKWWTMVDEYGNPLPQFEMYAKFAEKVGLLGELIAGAPVIDDHGVQAVVPTITLKTFKNMSIKGPRQRPAIHLGALRPQGMEALLVFAVNIDWESDHEVRITATAQTLAGKRLYDLIFLQPVPKESGRSWGRSCLRATGTPLSWPVLLNFPR